jgi:hypothetical protein
VSFSLVKQKTTRGLQLTVIPSKHNKQRQNGRYRQNIKNRLDNAGAGALAAMGALRGPAGDLATAGPAFFHRHF